MRGAGRRAAIALAAALPIGLAGCASPVPDDGGLDLARAGCPAEVRIRTDALPRVEQGALYELLGDDLTIDAGERSVTGELVAQGEPTGLDLTIISGDEHGDVSGSRALWADDDLLLAAVDADDALVDIETYPTVGIFAPLQRDPAIVFWDPQTYDASSIAVLGASFDAAGLRVTVRGGPADLAVDYLAGSGLVGSAEVDPSSDGTLDVFLAANGQIAQVGDATIEPYLFEHLPTGARPIQWQLLDDAEYPRYAGMLSARPDQLVRYADCLTELVPILQQATVDFVRDPDETAAVIVRLAAEFGAEWYTADLAASALSLLIERGMLGNGSDDIIGDFDSSRLQLMIDEATPAFRNMGMNIPDGIRAHQIATNEFIDLGIGL